VAARIEGERELEREGLRTATLAMSDDVHDAPTTSCHMARTAAKSLSVSILVWSESLACRA
jgi:hypothetical protein